jgi:allantoinase
MKYDMVVSNCRAVLPQGVTSKVSIGILDGKIAALNIGSNIDTEAKERIDALEMLVIPGSIDTHVHTQTRVGTETFHNATVAAAKGGVTTIVDMPFDHPPTLTHRLLKEKISRALESACVDFALYGGFTGEGDGLEEIVPQVEEGVVGFKLMTDQALTKERYPGLDPGAQLEAMEIIAKCDSLATVHTENPFIVGRLTNKLKRAGREDAAAWEEVRPVIAELEPLSRTLLFARWTKCRTCIAHVSIPEGIDFIKEAKRSGYNVYAETLPQLLLIPNLSKSGDRRCKFIPPSRDEQRREELWKKLADGDINVVGSDHTPYPKDMTKNVWEMAGGAGNLLEIILPLMLSEGASKRGLPIVRMVEVLSTGPAKMLGLYPKKGCIALGSDGDLVIIDTNDEWEIRADKLEYDKTYIDYCRNNGITDKWSAFEGWKVRGRIKKVLLRGRVISDNGNLCGSPGIGKMVKPLKAD